VQLLPLIPKLISKEQNHFLTKRISEEEVKAAFFHLKPFGALGPDGFPPRFFQHFWHLVKDESMVVVVESFTSRKMLRSLNHTFLALLPIAKDAK